VGIIALNEAEYIRNSIRQVYDWENCHEIIVVEGSVSLYPKNGLATDGLSGDGTTELIKSIPDPQNKIRYVSGVFKDKIEQRNEYAKRITGTHALVLDADEFYTLDDLRKLKEDVTINPDIDVFRFNFSQDMNQRTYFHLWYNFHQHVVGGYWDIPHNRIYKWVPGTLYQGEDHNHPVRPDGSKLLASTPGVKVAFTRAKCVHTGFAKLVQNQKDKNQYYLNRGEGREEDPILRTRRQMYIDCRIAYETWKPGDVLPHGAKLTPFLHALPESLLQHPYNLDPDYLLKRKNK